MSAHRNFQLHHHTDVLGDYRKVLLDSAREQTFTAASVLGDAKLAWRSAKVCFTWNLLAEARGALREVLGVSDTEIVDLQLTCSGEGDYFKPHYDNNWPETAERKVTFVYYLGDKATFTCGRLIFPEQAISVDPIDDSMVVFPAGELHEIEVVRATMSNPDAPARYTLNGWLR